MRPLLKFLPVVSVTAVTLMLTLTLAPPARAGACCMSATAAGNGRLLNWEDFALGLSSSMAYGMGRWTSDGEWRPHSENYSDIEWRTQLWGMFRLSEKWFVYGQLPWLVNQRESGTVRDVDGGLGDVQAGSRYEVLQVGEDPLLPAIAITGAVTAPTGTSVADSGGALAADATGRGAWVMSMGLSVEKTLLPWYVRLDVNASLPLAATRQDLGVSQRFGPSGEVALMGGLEVAEGVVVSVIGRYAQEGAITLDQEFVNNSGQTGTSVGGAVSWRASPHWTLQGGVETGLFLNGLGDNSPGRITTTLGLRYGHF